MGVNAGNKSSISRTFSGNVGPGVLANASSQTEMVPPTTEAVCWRPCSCNGRKFSAWSLTKGVAHDAFPDRHGNVRQVTVRTSTSVLQRDVRKLCLLERASKLKAERKP